jgi:hypothetical protein
MVLLLSNCAQSDWVEFENLIISMHVFARSASDEAISCVIPKSDGVPTKSGDVIILLYIFFCLNQNRDALSM